MTQLAPGDWKWQVSRDLVGYRSELEILKDVGTVRFDDIGLHASRRARERYGCVADDFASVQGDVQWSMGFARGDWRVETHTRQRLTCTRTHLVVDAELDGFEGGRRTYSDNWRFTFPRDLL
jgi:uncharacterized protein